MDLRKMFATIARPELAFAIIFCVSMTFSLSTAATGQTVTRFWSDNSGSFSTEAELVKISGTSVILRKTNQVVIEVPFSRLSQGDLDFVKQEISRLNGATPKPTKKIAPKRSLGSDISSRNFGEPLPKKTNKEQLANSTPPATKATTQQAPLRYSAKPDAPASEPLALAAPLMPDSIPPVVPAKDNVTSPPSDVARLKPPLKSQSEFTLGHSRPKKPPIILKSPVKVAKSDTKPTQKSLGKIESTFQESPAKPTSYEPSRAANELRLPKIKSTASDNDNDLRTRSFVPETSPKAAATEFAVDEKTKRASGKDDQPNFFQPATDSTTNSPEANDFKRGDFVATSDPAIVILSNESPSKNIQKTPDSDLTTGETSRTETANTTFSFDKKPNEIKNEFDQSEELSPTATSSGLAFQPSNGISKESLTKLPPRFQRLVEQAMSADDNTQVRAAVTEIQSNWPPQRYPAIIDAVQKCVVAKDAATRILAIETLAQNDSEKSLEHIVSGIDDPSFEVREATHKILEGLSNSKLIPMLVEKLSSDQGERVATTLSKLGPEVEPHVVSFATDNSTKMQLTVLNLLSAVGTQKSIKTLQSIVANSKTARVRLHASNAINRINSRLDSEASMDVGP